MTTDGTADSRRASPHDVDYDLYLFIGGSAPSTSPPSFTGVPSQVQVLKKISSQVLPEKKMGEKERNKICFENRMKFT